MCNFFSFVSDGHGNFKFFDYATRRTLPSDMRADSHASICAHFGLTEDQINKYELTRDGFVADTINAKDDSRRAKVWAEEFMRSDEFKAICASADISADLFIAEYTSSPDRMRLRRIEAKKRAKEAAIAKRKSTLERKKRDQAIKPIIGTKRDFKRFIDGLVKEI